MIPSPPEVDERSMPERMAALDWERVALELDSHGCAVIGPLLSAHECRAISGLYDRDESFRKRIVMGHHGYGMGEYKYFSYPLPGIVEALRGGLYPPLANIANRWNEAMKVDVRYPPEHGQFLKRCHDAGQTRPTPLVLRYGEDDFNCLHQDLYGEHVFALQVAILLSQPGAEFSGGEFVLTEQRMRRQSRAEVVPLGWGQGVVFPVYHRPVVGTRGFQKAVMRHGVSRIRSGHRFTLGIIFHDSK